METSEGRKNGKIKKVISRIFYFIFGLIVVGWIAIVLFDFYQVKMTNNPKFCIKNETINYDNRTTSICTGIGYKVYRYELEGTTIIEFSPFWKEERTNFDDNQLQ